MCWAIYAVPCDGYVQHFRLSKDYSAVTPCEILNWVVISSEKNWRLFTTRCFDQYALIVIRRMMRVGSQCMFTWDMASLKGLEAILLANEQLLYTALKMEWVDNLITKHAHLKWVMFLQIIFHKQCIELLWNFNIFLQRRHFY